jgi:hypothetical protein
MDTQITNRDLFPIKYVIVKHEHRGTHKSWFLNFECKNMNIEGHQKEKKKKSFGSLFEISQATRPSTTSPLF